MPFDTLLPALAVLAVFVGLLVVLWLLKRRGVGFTPRVFTALGLGIALGVGIQLALGRGSEAATAALDWMAVVGQGYIALLKMLVMPLVFVAIVGAFTRTQATEHLGRIGAVVLAVLLGTVAVAALTGWAAVVLSGLAGASFTDAGASANAASLEALQAGQQQVADLTLPQMILSFIPVNVFADLAGSRATSTIAVVIFAAIVGLAYLKLRDRDSEQADFFKQLIDSLYGIVMRIVAMVLALTPYGVLALIAHVMATSDYAAVLDLGKFVAVSYGALAFMFLVHLVILFANRVSPLAYVRKAFPVLSFAFVARSSAGAVPLNIETQTHALGVDEATANFAASFGMSIGQNGCAGIYPAMLATIIAPTVGIDVLSPTFVAGLVAVVVISSFGVAGVGGGATFASLIVLGTMGLPIEIVGLLASVEPLIDMGRTALNVSDSMVAGVTASNAIGALDRTVLRDPAARVSSDGHGGM
ncbi:L-cystine transporter [Arabiibacter massiliensis]|uniref:L-cystine transporter n=1 Tax=Arabiibacter massiliensis TaxID=1870985 RepID=UPI0009B9BE5C|nr:cation:dicarboxylase symporter family transporter [Arabiibacter massiliensis]